MNRTAHALVVGASGGIGLAVTARLLCHGFSVSATFRSHRQALETFGADSKLNIFELDVADRSACKDVVAKAEAGFGPVSGLVYAAGITRDRSFSLMSIDDWSEVLTANLSGAFYVTQEVVKSMMMEKRGRIVFIGSVSGQLGNAGQVNYSAAKAGLMGMARSLAVELGPFDITCNVVAPGPIETPMTQEVPIAKVDNLRRKIPLRRLGSTNDVAGLVHFLLSKDGEYISGQVLNVDGGLLAT